MESSKRIAEEVFPAEVWEMIFKNVTDEKDLLNCYHTCSLFRSLLETFMLSQAFRVVETHLSESNIQLTEKDVLTCRLVSRQWRHIVDHFLQCRPSRLDLSCYRAKSIGFQHSFADQADIAPNHFGSILLRLHKLEETRSLVEQITANAKVQRNENVFCGRHLIIVDVFGTYNESTEIMKSNKQQFYDIVSRFLEKCGSHIWYLSVCSLILGKLPHWFLNTFWKWLQLLPNLKMITCQITMDYLQSSNQDEIINELQTGITRQPFPHLPQLVTLQINGAPDIVLHSALEVNRHVKKVEVNPFPYRSGIPLDINRWRNTPLTEFCITVCHIEELDILTSTEWPLEKLTLTFALGPHPFSAFESRMERLENFGRTLKYLRLKVPKINLGTHGPQWQLQLPHLEELHLHLIDHGCLDFIEPLRSLRNLKLSVVFWEESGEPQVMLRGRVCAMINLYQSNIWEVLPTVRQVEVHINYRVKRADVGTSRHRYPRNIKYYRSDRIKTNKFSVTA